MQENKIHASQSPVGYYHVLNCDLQTQAVLKQEQKRKSRWFLLTSCETFLEHKRMSSPLQLAIPTCK